MLATLSIDCRVKILIQNIIEVFCVLYLGILYMIGLPLWDKVSMNLAQYCLK